LLITLHDLLSSSVANQRLYWILSYGCDKNSLSPSKSTFATALSCASDEEQIDVDDFILSSVCSNSFGGIYRRVHLAGMTRYPKQEWVVRRAKEVLGIMED
jgi:hypothetical protein